MLRLSRTNLRYDVLFYKTPSCDMALLYHALHLLSRMAAFEPFAVWVARMFTIRKE